MAPTNHLSATEALAQIRKGSLTVTQLAKDHLQRYCNRDSTIHAWAYLDEERILAEAKRLDEIPMEKRGPLHGLILGVKDIIHTKDMPTQHGSPLYRDHSPNVDASVSATCRAAGALIYGKTHTTEFACMGKGPETCNPWDPKRTPGGSSSGSAAGVADYQCQMSLGTQTGGSVIRPGSFNGIFGMKPTWGSISREGVKIYSITLDTVGFYARSIQDLKLFAKALDITDDQPPTPKPLNQCTFAYIKTDQWSHATPDVQKVWEESKSLLLQGGAKVKEMELPKEFEELGEASHKAIVSGEGRVNFLAEYRIAGEELSNPMKTHVDKSDGITRKDLLAGYDRFAALRPIFDGIARNYDAIITPSVVGEPPVGQGYTGDARFCRMWTGLHVPVINLPGFFGTEGMPIGLSLVGARYSDERLLTVAEEVAKVWSPGDRHLLK